MYKYLILLTIFVASIINIQGYAIPPRGVAAPPPGLYGNNETLSENPLADPLIDEELIYRLQHCQGMPCDEYESMQKKIEEIMDIDADLQDPSGGEWIGPDGLVRELPAENGTLDGCIWLTAEQAQVILEATKAERDAKMGIHNRHKRNLDKGILSHPNARKWDFPIVWKFDGQHSSSEQEHIRGAFSHWEENTCVRFKEIPLSQSEKDNHIIISRYTTGCHSYVGKTYFKPQMINLQSNCLWQFGISVHEIGHALGLWHQQQRFDRDDHIRILYENLGAYKSQFTKLTQTVSLGVPYDPQSVMHYSSKDGSSNTLPTMVHRNPLFTQSFGQRTGLSFYDAKIINKAYCKDTCAHSPLTQSCQHGGYQDPNNCRACKCMEGWEGQYCQYLAAPKGDTCGGELVANSQSEQEIVSPGYRGRRYYNDNTECNWKIKAPAGHTIKLRFDGAFGVYCHYHQQCFHWVEVKTSVNLDQPGPRFCCYTTPTAEILSEGQEMLITLRSNFTTPWTTARRGFKALYTAVPDGNLNIPTTTTEKTTTSTTTKAPTTTSTTTTTTPTTTTTTRAPVVTSGQVLFDCSFESNWCGMIQDTRDQFDWTRTDKATPSDPTGPDYAHTGRYYVFIETSNPRRKNDQATIYVPELGSYHGPLCIRFNYHMFGHHIRTLKAFRLHDGVKVDFFTAKGEIGNRWNQAVIDVDLQKNDLIGFTGIRGDEYSGDIGLDDIIVATGSC